MKIYGIVGTSQQTLVESNSYTPMAGEVLMQSARPDGEYIAQADGTWKAVEPTPVEPTPVEPTLDERVTTLESENAALKADNISMNDTMLAIVEMLDIASE